MGSSNGKPVLRDEDVATLSKSSGMDEAQVKTAFDNFVTEHPDGKMRPKDFREMMQKAIPGKDAKKMASELAGRLAEDAIALLLPKKADLGLRRTAGGVVCRIIAADSVPVLFELGQAGLLPTLPGLWRAPTAPM